MVSGAGSKVSPAFYGTLDSPFQYGANGEAVQLPLPSKRGPWGQGVWGEGV